MSRHRSPRARACALALALAAAPAGAAETAAIYGGNKVKPCAWPTTVALGGCTGTLVHPELVVFAAHCMEGGGGPSLATFGDDENYPAFSVPTKSCAADPKYYAQSGHDVAFCKLAKPVTQVPIVPILMGCETQVLVQGAQVIAVGFGQANDGLGWGPKREVAMALNSVQNGEAFIGGAGKDTCYGDSGGPVFVQLGDGSWRVFGITSYGEYCGGGGYYSMMHTAIDWLEQTSGLDLTPCHQQGQWAPTAACAGFPKSPGLGGGAWSAGCPSADVSGPSSTCGAPFGGGPTGSGGESSSGGSGGSPANTGGIPGASGGAASGGQSAAPPVATPGCSTAPDCGACASCAEHCTCATGDAVACADACAPYAPSPSAGGPSAPPLAGSPRENTEVTAGCACRTGTERAPSGSLALLAASLAGAALWRRR